MHTAESQTDQPIVLEAVQRSHEQEPVSRTWLITNATVVTPSEVIQKGYVWVENGIIKEVGAIEDRKGAEGRDPRAQVTHVSAGQTIDAKGAIVMPGIIDIHTDAMDIEIVPRPGADIPVAIAFRELERKMGSCGFTTVFHSLHLGYEAAEKQSRSSYSRMTVFKEVARAAGGPTLLHNRIHLRYELSGIDAYDACMALIEGGYVSLLSVMDHTPGQGQFNKSTFREYTLSQGKSEAQFEEELRERLERPKIEGERLRQLIQAAIDRHIPVASHDDDTVEKVEAMYDIGVRISEFPINLKTAQYATEIGMHVAGGASNILRGGSLSGNLNMAEAVHQGAVGILCSDYYPASILHAVFKLHRERQVSLPEAVNLATLHPARATGLDRVTGSLEPGKQADLLMVRLHDGLPMVTHNMVSGTFVLQTAHK